MSGRHSRNKGKRGEREVANALSDAGFVGIKRGWQARVGSTECDVEGTPWWLEVKRGKRCNPRAAYRQAVSDTDGRMPVVVWRDDREDWMVTLSFKDFIELALGCHLDDQTD